jgi:uncharacterized protein (TIGR00369 family)
MNPLGDDPDTYLDRDEILARTRHALDTAEPGFGTFFLARFLGLRISYDDAEQRCVVELPYARFLGNPQGSLHGGVIATAMDISMGHLCHRYLSTAMTIELEMRFLRPVQGDCRCEARLLRAGRRIVHLESRLYDTDDRLAAFATGSWHRINSGGSGDQHG